MVWLKYDLPAGLSVFLVALPLCLGKKQFLPFIITITAILLTDLLIGVTVGLLISIYFIVENNFRADYKLQRTILDEKEIYLIKLNRNVSFLNKVKPRDRNIEVHLSGIEKVNVRQFINN